MSTLLALIARTAFGREHARARIDAAWLLAEAGNTARATALLAGAVTWRSEHPAGLAALARLASATGQADLARELQQQALDRFRGTAPVLHRTLLQAYAAQFQPGRRAAAPGSAGHRQLAARPALRPAPAATRRRETSAPRAARSRHPEGPAHGACAIHAFWLHRARPDRTETARCVPKSAPKASGERDHHNGHGMQTSCE